MLAQVHGAAARIGDPSGADRNIRDGLVVFEGLLAGGTAFEDLLGSMCLSPLEALQVLPGLVVDAIAAAIDRGLLPRDPNAPAPSAEPMQPVETHVAASEGAAPDDTGHAPNGVAAQSSAAGSPDLQAIMRGMGATASDFEEALTAGFDDALGMAARIAPRDAVVLRERIAEAAAGVHLVTGGAHVVRRYLSRRRRDPRIRRWGARVRTIVRAARIPLPLILSCTVRRGPARRAPRRRSHHHARALSRAGPDGDPEPDEPASKPPEHPDGRGGAL